MSDLVQLVFSGMALGAVYGLIALGFVAIFSVREIVNLAQGEFAALSGLTAIRAVAAGVPLVWGPEAQRLPDFPGKDFVVGGVSVRSQELWVLGVAAVVAYAVVWFYEHTTAGKALRACAGQPIAARLLGISPRTATMVTFAVAGFTGAIAGVVGSPVYLSSWNGGLTLGLKGFVAATLGGLVSFRVAMLGGLLLGVLESLAAGYGATGYRDAVAFVVLLLVLLVRPQSLSLKATGVRV